MSQRDSLSGRSTFEQGLAAGRHDRRYGRGVDARDWALLCRPDDATQRWWDGYQHAFVEEMGA